MANVPGVPSGPRPIHPLMGPLGISVAGMSRQQAFMEVISRNIANAGVTRGPDGLPYHRQIAIAGIDKKTGELTTTVVEYKSTRPIYDPDHPDHDADGNVLYPNIDVDMEQMNLMIARRMHDANATVFQSAKAMLRKALEI